MVRASDAYCRSRPSRSFVASLSTPGTRRVMFRCAHYFPISFDPYNPDGEPLEVEDRSGERVPAADFYEWAREQFCEFSALQKAVGENLPDSVDAHDASCEAFHNLTEGGNHFDTVPHELLELFCMLDNTLIPKIVASQLYRHQNIVRNVLRRRLSAADPLNVIISFLDVDLTHETFLPRAELPVVLQHVVESENAREARIDDGSERTYSFVRVYSGEHGPQAKFRTIRLRNGRVRWEKRWQVFREGEEDVGFWSKDRAVASDFPPVPLPLSEYHRHYTNPGAGRHWANPP